MFESRKLPLVWISQVAALCTLTEESEGWRKLPCSPGIVSCFIELEHIIYFHIEFLGSMGNLRTGKNQDNIAFQRQTLRINPIQKRHKKRWPELQSSPVRSFRSSVPSRTSLALPPHWRHWNFKEVGGFNQHVGWCMDIITPILIQNVIISWWQMESKFWFTSFLWWIGDVNES